VRETVQCAAENNVTPRRHVYYRLMPMPLIVHHDIYDAAPAELSRSRPPRYDCRRRDAGVRAASVRSDIAQRCAIGWMRQKECAKSSHRITGNRRSPTDYRPRPLSPPMIITTHHHTPNSPPMRAAETGAHRCA